MEFVLCWKGCRDFIIQQINLRFFCMHDALNVKSLLHCTACWGGTLIVLKLSKMPQVPSWTWWIVDEQLSKGLLIPFCCEDPLASILQLFCWFWCSYTFEHLRRSVSLVNNCITELACVHIRHQFLIFVGRML